MHKKKSLTNSVYFDEIYQVFLMHIFPFYAMNVFLYDDSYALRFTEHKLCMHTK